MTLVIMLYIEGKKKLCLSPLLKDENDTFDKTHLNNISTQMTEK